MPPSQEPTYNLQQPTAVTHNFATTNSSRPSSTETIERSSNQKVSPSRHQGWYRGPTGCQPSVSWRKCRHAHPRGPSESRGPPWRSRAVRRFATGLSVWSRRRHSVSIAFWGDNIIFPNWRKAGWKSRHAVRRQAAYVPARCSCNLVSCCEKYAALCFTAETKIYSLT